MKTLGGMLNKSKNIYTGPDYQKQHAYVTQREIYFLDKQGVCEWSLYFDRFEEPAFPMFLSSYIIEWEIYELIFVSIWVLKAVKKSDLGTEYCFL